MWNLFKYESFLHGYDETIYGLHGLYAAFTEATEEAFSQVQTWKVDK